MIAIEFFIPTYGNDKVTFTPAHFAQWEAHILPAFGGFSRLPGTVEGKWLDKGKRADDVHIVYLVAARPVADGAAIRASADFARALFAQDGIFIRYLGVTEIL
jgi:hypothetical protein